MSGDTMEKHHRRSIRLRGYDYTQPGAYFITVCIEGRQCVLGEIAGDKMRLNEAGRMVETTWEAIPTQYSGVEIDAFVVMPNHIHGIIVLVGADPRVCPENMGAPRSAPLQRWERETTTNPAQPQWLSLSTVVQRFKTLTTKRYMDGVNHYAWPPFPGRLWQRNYYEHIIRNEAALEQIRQYIADNPARWAVDRENPVRTSP
jgi:REP element-mobilizing transposase RayT